MEDAKTTKQTKTILLVDDDQDFLFQQRLQLEATGFRVAEANTAADAMRAFESAKPDLAIVDLMMENLDAGFTLCYQMKKKRPAMPIIMVTAVATETGMDFDASTEEERAWIKADVLLAKPIRFEQLKREVERLLT
ncbi:MAG TPA: response regulator [Candidatus Hydrogenedentes bacterium]|nr:response regulator [Candidatus Hydrogenedentota bacterium]